MPLSLMFYKTISVSVELSDGAMSLHKVHYHFLTTDLILNVFVYNKNHFSKKKNFLTIGYQILLIL